MRVLIGDHTQYATNSSANFVRYLKYIATATGTLIGLEVYSQVAGNIKLAIYSDNGGVPSTRLAYGTIACLTNQWNQLTGLSVSITNGTAYWLCEIADTAGTESFTSSSGSFIRNYKSATYSSYSFASSWDGPSGYTSDSGTGAYSIDGFNVVVDITVTADTLFKKLDASKTVTSDALFKILNQSKTLTADVLLERLGLSNTFTADTVFLRYNIAKILTADVLIQRLGLSKTLTADLLIQIENQIKTLTADVLFRGPISEYEYYTDTNSAFGGDIGEGVAQTFNPQISHTLKIVKLSIRNQLGHTGSVNCTCNIYAVDGNHKPTGNSLVNATVSDGWTVSTDQHILTFDFGNGIPLNANTEYAIFLTADTAGIIGWDYNTACGYTRGQAWGYSASWNAFNPNRDFYFQEWGDIEYTTLTKTLTADVLFKLLAITKTLTADTIFQRLSLTKTVTSDVLFKKSDIAKQLIADVIFAGAVTLLKTLVADVLFQRLDLSQSLTADSIFYSQPEFEGRQCNFLFIPNIQILVDTLFKQLDIDTSLSVGLNLAAPFWDKELPIDMILSLADIPLTFDADVLFKRNNIDATLPLYLNLWQQYTLDDLLEIEQKKRTYKPYIKATFVSPSKTVTRVYTWGKPLIDVNEHIDPWKHIGSLVLNNADRALAGVDFEGWTVTLSWGAYINGVPHSVDSPPMKVFPQTYESRPGLLTVALDCKGIITQMDEDQARTTQDMGSESVQQIIEDIITAQAPYDDCPAYGVVWHATDPSLNVIPGTVPEGIDTLKNTPFYIPINTTRSKALRDMVDHTPLIMRVEADSKFHFYRPVTSGTPQKEYKLTSGHAFFEKQETAQMAVPNKIVVYGIPPLLDQFGYPINQIMGTAQDNESVAIMGEKIYYETWKGLTSNSDCTNFANSILAKIQMHTKTAEATIPMDCFRQIFDFVRITDVRQNSSKDGNIGYIQRYFNPKAGYRMSFGFGGWADYLKANMYITSGELPPVVTTPNIMSIVLPDTTLQVGEYIYIGELTIPGYSLLYLLSLDIHASEGKAMISIESLNGTPITPFPINSTFSQNWVKKPMLVYTTSNYNTILRIKVYNPDLNNPAKFVNASMNYDIRSNSDPLSNYQTPGISD